MLTPGRRSPSTRLAIAADGEDTATLLPRRPASSRMIDGVAYEVEDALEIASDMPATYRVEIDHFPYRAFVAEIVRPRMKLVIRKDIAALRRAGIAEVNRMVGAVRASFVTVIPAQDMVYLEKAAEARRFLAAYPTPEDVPDEIDPDPALGFPFILAEIGITAPTACEVAAVYVDRRRPLPRRRRRARDRAARRRRGDRGRRRPRRRSTPLVASCAAALAALPFP